jgi:phage-related tail fiber protein
MATIIDGTTNTTIAGNATVQGNLTVTGTLIGGVPSGSVFWFAASTPPTGYLKANGAAVSRTTYAALFAVVGTTYGSGDGSTTFNLPDLRGEFIRGWDDGRGVDPARSFGSSQTDEFEAHTHTMTNTGGANSAPVAGGNYAAGSGFGGTAQGSASSSTGSTETRPRNVALLPCIKT